MSHKRSCTGPGSGLTPARLPTRREFLWHTGGGLGGIALASLLLNDKLIAADGSPPSAHLPHTLGLHHAPKAKRVIQLFMNGGASQCDTFDYKPELIKRNGQKFDPGNGQVVE